ncbi:type II toxin-antitoxin system RelE/ParE family toxin [Rhizorhabdus wittichii]|uniref:type II toxin-antitoxin system RelE/ParE family toxin n=1 Tax=Rhizorhabdus wittichii TaxID=160791 RepID=UPI001D01BC0B|nr:type II toxin-antitoxin system RelE/ParE family toxin [Rhizorhabdus wittichii]
MADLRNRHGGGARQITAHAAKYLYGNAVLSTCTLYGITVQKNMHTVIETAAYLAAAKDAGMDAAEQAAVVDLIAANPEAGDVMPGCGGARKLRVAKPGRGKSGGYRVITYFAGEDVPVFLLTVFGKNEKANLTKGERNALAGLTKRLRDTL